MTAPEPIEISVIVPVYGCEECLEELHSRLVAVLESLCPSYEIILINDDSPDDCWTFIRRIAEKNNNVKAINFSRNYGQHYALTAGFDVAQGNWVVAMDCDLQDPPEEIRKLYRKAMEGYDVVFGVADFRGKPGLIYTQVRKAYFAVLDSFSGNKFKTTNMAFYIASKLVVLNIRKFREQSRHLSSLIRGLGFDIVGIEVVHEERKYGHSSYTLTQRISLGLEGIITYSTTLLKLALFLGFAFSIVSLIASAYIFMQAVTVESYALAGWASTITVVLLMTGLILIFLGVLGLYIDKIFLEVKNRPLYTVRETINLGENEF